MSMSEKLWKGNETLPSQYSIIKHGSKELEIITKRLFPSRLIGHEAENIRFCLNCETLEQLSEGRKTALVLMAIGCTILLVVVVALVLRACVIIKIMNIYAAWSLHGGGGTYMIVIDRRPGRGLHKISTDLGNVWGHMPPSPLPPPRGYVSGMEQYWKERTDQAWEFFKNLIKKKLISNAVYSAYRYWGHFPSFLLLNFLSLLRPFQVTLMPLCPLPSRRYDTAYVSRSREHLFQKAHEMRRNEREGGEKIFLRW